MHKLFGDKHANIAASLNAVGVCHHNQGQFEDALNYFKDSLKCNVNGYCQISVVNRHVYSYWRLEQNAFQLK